MFTDDQLLPISALQHFNYCPRRAALIHVEGLWAENRFTAEGNVLHRRTDDPSQSDSRPGVRTARALEIRSYHLGLCGRADVVEFHTNPETNQRTVLPVEYKRGKPKPRLDEPFRIQLCAQALCLEEMLNTTIPEGVLYFGKAKRRVRVPLDDALRQRTIESVAALRKVILAGQTPSARKGAKCRRCSMVNLCMPGALRPQATARRYLEALTSGSAGDKSSSPPTPP